MSVNLQQELNHIIELKGRATRLDTLIQGYRLCARTEGKSENTTRIANTALNTLKRFLESREFMDATTGSINTKRMDDRECVLRYCAFHLKPLAEYREPDLNKYLSSTMETINNMNEDDIAALSESFRRAMLLSRQVFGENAFRKMFEKYGYRFPINKALFEVWSVSLEKFTDDEIHTNRDKIIRGFINTMNHDSDYLESLSQSTGSLTRVRKRFETTLSIIKEALS